MYWIYHIVHVLYYTLVLSYSTLTQYIEYIILYMYYIIYSPILHWIYHIVHVLYYTLLLSYIPHMHSILMYLDISYCTCIILYCTVTVTHLYSTHAQYIDVPGYIILYMYYIIHCYSPIFHTCTVY